MAVQFLLGTFISVINIMIHALVTVAAIDIARTAGLKHTTQPRSHLMAVMVTIAVILMVAHTLGTCLGAGLRSGWCGTRGERVAVFHLRELHHAGLR